MMAAALQYRTLVQTADGYEEQVRTAAGPFFHGGRARVRPGAALTAGHRTNSWGDERGCASFVYFSADLETAAAYARATGGRLYEVEPTGEVQLDNYGGTESFKTRCPLRVIRRVPDGEWS